MLEARKRHYEVGFLTFFTEILGSYLKKELLYTVKAGGEKSAGRTFIKTYRVDAGKTSKANRDLDEKFPIKSGSHKNNRLNRNRGERTQ